MGVREKNKKRRQSAIYTAAISLFDANGYANTTIEAIADKAEVGVGTVYNYFNSKGELLIKLLDTVTEEVEKQVDEIITVPADAPIQGILDCVKPYFELFYTFRKDLWREILAMGVVRKGSLEIGFMGLDDRMLPQLRQLLAHYHSLGKVRPELDTTLAAQTIFSITIMEFFAFIQSNQRVVDHFLHDLAAKLQQIFDGFHVEKSMDLKPGPVLD